MREADAFNDFSNEGRDLQKRDLSRRQNRRLSRVHGLDHQPDDGVEIVDIITHCSNDVLPAHQLEDVGGVGSCGRIRGIGGVSHGEEVLFSLRLGPVQAFQRLPGLSFYDIIKSCRQE